MITLATCELYSSFIHGANPDGTSPEGEYIIIYDYPDLCTDWYSETKYYKKKILKCIQRNQINHPIRNYLKLNKKTIMHLIEKYTDHTGRELCILHTYKMNLFKRIWKKKFYNSNSNSIY